jgi:hypothetical protein
MSANSEQSALGRIVNIKDLIRALMALQIAISKLVIELINKESAEGNLYAPMGTDAVDEECGPTDPFDEECGPPPPVDEECGPVGAVDEECGPVGAVDEECGPVGAVDEECGPTNYLDEACRTPQPVPDVCEEETIAQLCERLDAVSRYLKTICKMVR